MPQVANRLLKHHGSRLSLLGILLVGLCLAGTPSYSTAKPTQALVSSPTNWKPATLTASNIVPATRTRSRPLQSLAATLAPFLDIVPSSDGTEVYVSASGFRAVGAQVFANLEIGPGHDKGSYTMAFS